MVSEPLTEEINYVSYDFTYPQFTLSPLMSWTLSSISINLKSYTDPVGHGEQCSTAFSCKSGENHILLLVSSSVLTHLLTSVHLTHVKSLI